MLEFETLRKNGESCHLFGVVGAGALLSSLNRYPTIRPWSLLPVQNRLPLNRILSSAPASRQDFDLAGAGFEIGGSDQDLTLGP